MSAAAVVLTAGPFATAVAAVALLSATTDVWSRGGSTGGLPRDGVVRVEVGGGAAGVAVGVAVRVSVCVADARVGVAADLVLISSRIVAFKSLFSCSWVRACAVRESAVETRSFHEGLDLALRPIDAPSRSRAVRISLRNDSASALSALAAS